LPAARVGWWWLIAMGVALGASPASAQEIAITGTVTAGGRPVSNVSVRAMASGQHGSEKCDSNDDLQCRCPSGAKCTSTGEDGTFRLNLKPGTYDIVACPICRPRNLENDEKHYANWVCDVAVNSPQVHEGLIVDARRSSPVPFTLTGYPEPKDNRLARPEPRFLDIFDHASGCKVGRIATDGEGRFKFPAELSAQKDYELRFHSTSQVTVKVKE